MTTLNGKAIKDTYKDLLQFGGGQNNGVTATLKYLEDGEGDQTVLQLSTTKLKVNGDLEVTGAVAGLANGVDGTDGISVTAGTVNSSGELVLTMSDSSTINCGVVKGADGVSPDAPTAVDGVDGVSVTGAEITTGNRLKLTLSNGTELDAGIVVSSVTAPANFPGIYANNSTTKLSDSSLINQIAIGSGPLYQDYPGTGLQTAPTGNFYPAPTLFVEGGTTTILTSFYNNQYPGVYNRQIINYQYYPDGSINEKGYYGNMPDGGSKLAKEMPDGRSVEPLPYLRDLFAVYDFYYWTDTFTVSQGSTPSDGSGEFRRRYSTTHEFEQKWKIDTPGKLPNPDSENDDGGRRGQYLFEQNFYFAQYPLEVNETPTGFAGFFSGTFRNCGLFYDCGHPFREKSITPNAIGTIASGSNLYRWKNIYSAASVTVVSDENTKQDIESLNSAEQATAKACKGLVRKFKMKDAVNEKGDKARTHFGVIAQDVISAFEDNGLDPFEYGIVCTSKFYEVWEHSFDNQDAVLSKDEPQLIEEHGEKQRINFIRLEADPEIEGVEQIVQYSVRYDELLAFIISAI